MVLIVLVFTALFAGCGGGGKYGAYDRDQLECKYAHHGSEVDVLMWRKKGVDAALHAQTFARVCVAANRALNAGDPVAAGKDTP